MIQIQYSAGDIEVYVNTKQHAYIHSAKSVTVITVAVLTMPGMPLSFAASIEVSSVQHRKVTLITSATFGGSTGLVFYRRLYVCLSASNFEQNVRTDLHKIFRQGWQLAKEQTIKFWWRSGPRIRIRIATLIRRP